MAFQSEPGYAQLRVVGYIHNWGRNPDLGKINFKKITHLNVAFVNPDSAGNLKVPYGIDTIVRTARRNNVKVLASIGGGSQNPYYASLLSDSRREEFLDKLVQFADDYQFDGIDVDLENDAIDSNYGKVITYLGKRLKLNKKLLTAALATWNASKIGDSTLKHFDFINIMSYDQTGPWRPDRPGQHSSYEKAVEDLQYWRVQRRLPKEKVNLGVPFYGHAFGTQFGESMWYRDIIATFSNVQAVDSVRPPSGGIIYYNGISTIKRKVQVARKEAGGIMIWQLLQDAEGEQSLLNAINNK